MYMSKTSSKIPSGITIDIEDSPTDNTISDSWFGNSTSEPSSDSYTKSRTSNSTSSNSTSYSNFSYFRIGMIIVILLFLGINIFSYLGDFFQNITDTSSPIIKSVLTNLGFVVTETTKDVTELTADVAKLGVDVAAGTLESGIDVIQGQLDTEQNGSQKKSTSSSKNSKKNTLSASLSNALADAEYNSEPLPDDATSSTQRHGSNKSGYCYIGEDRGFRSCISVNENDVCMSGEIFPTNDICVNPSLRE
jgi:hypothetical protein